MVKLQKSALVGVAAVAVFILSSLIRYYTDERGKHDVATNYYRGTIQTAVGTYEVSIDENDEGYGFQKIVELHPVGTPSYAGITGHAYKNHTQWDRVFFCGESEIAGQDPTAGCNSVIRMSNGWKFEPCDADKGKVKPFSHEALRYAIAQLDTAMREVYNHEHITEQWRWDRKQKKVIQTYGKS